MPLDGGSRGYKPICVTFSPQTRGLGNCWFLAREEVDITALVTPHVDHDNGCHSTVIVADILIATLNLDKKERNGKSFGKMKNVHAQDVAMLEVGAAGQMQRDGIPESNTMNPDIYIKTIITKMVNSTPPQVI
jgi:hypothetical protein